MLVNLGESTTVISDVLLGGDRARERHVAFRTTRTFQKKQFGLVIKIFADGVTLAGLLLGLAKVCGK